MKVNTSVKEFKAAAALMILDAKEAIVRALSVPWAKPDAAVALVREFRKATEKDILLRWTIASGLSIVPNDSVFDDLVAIACDKRYSNAREMIAIALGKSSNQKAIRALIALLSDPEVQGHAVMTLVDLQAKEAVPAIRKLVNHPKKWVREEAAKALQILCPEKQGSGGRTGSRLKELSPPDLVGRPKDGRRSLLMASVSSKMAAFLECGGKRSATPPFFAQLPG